MMMEIAELTKQYFEDFETFKEQMEKFDKAGLVKFRVVSNKDKYVTVQGRVTTSIYAGVDPVNVLVLLALALYGLEWTLLPDTKQAFKDINSWWRQKVKEARNNHS